MRKSAPSAGLCGPLNATCQLGALKLLPPDAATTRPVTPGPPGTPVSCEADQMPKTAEAAPHPVRRLGPAAPAHPRNAWPSGCHGVYTAYLTTCGMLPNQGRAPCVSPMTTSGSADSCCSVFGIMHKLYHTLQIWQGNNDLPFRQSMGEGGMQVDMALLDKRGRQAAVQGFGTATIVARPFHIETVGALTSFTRSASARPC